jgi:hypothetical protein
MRKIKLISVVAIIALFVSVLSSCGSKSGKKLKEKAQKAELEKHIIDSTQKVEVKKPDPVDYVFTPSRVGVSPKKEINDGMMILGEGAEVKGTSLEFDVFTFDSTGQEFKFNVSAGYAKDVSYYGGDNPAANQKVAKEIYDEAKKLYNKITNTSKEDFIVTCSSEGYPKRLERVNRVENNNKKIGKVDLIEFDQIEVLLPLYNY